LVEEYEGKRLEGLGRSEEALLKSRQSFAAAETGLARSPSDIGLNVQALASEESIAEILAHQGDHPGALEMARKAIARWSFTALVPMSSQAPAWLWRYTGGAFTAFDPLPGAFGLGANGASRWHWAQASPRAVLYAAT
jgi:hypothetical protein